MIAVTIFLVCFVVLVGVVMYLSKTIEHGEARFDADGKVIKDGASRQADQHTGKHTGPTKPAQRISEQGQGRNAGPKDTDETPNTNGNKDDE